MAIFDRSIHHSHIINISEENYSIKDKIKAGVSNLGKI